MGVEPSQSLGGIGCWTGGHCGQRPDVRPGGGLGNPPCRGLGGVQGEQRPAVTWENQGVSGPGLARQPSSQALESTDRWGQLWDVSVLWELGHLPWSPQWKEEERESLTDL